MVWPAFWTILEVHMSIVCINLPTLGYVLKNFQSRSAPARSPSPFPALPPPVNPFLGRGDDTWEDVPLQDVAVRLSPPQIYSPTARPLPPMPITLGFPRVPPRLAGTRRHTPSLRHQHTSRCEPVDRVSRRGDFPARGIQVERNWAVDRVYYTEEEWREMNPHQPWY